MKNSSASLHLMFFAPGANWNESATSSEQSKSSANGWRFKSKRAKIGILGVFNLFSALCSNLHYKKGLTKGMVIFFVISF